MDQQSLPVIDLALGKSKFFRYLERIVQTVEPPMPEDVLAELRAKEEEMEAILARARQEAAAIREEALRSSREIREAARAMAAEEVRALEASERALMEEEANKVEEQGKAEAAELRSKGERNMEKVVSEVMRFLMPGAK